MNVGSTDDYRNHLLCRSVLSWMLAGDGADCKWRRFAYPTRYCSETTYGISKKNCGLADCLQVATP